MKFQTNPRKVMANVMYGNPSSRSFYGYRPCKIDKLLKYNVIKEVTWYTTTLQVVWKLFVETQKCIRRNKRAEDNLSTKKGIWTLAF